MLSWTSSRTITSERTKNPAGGLVIRVAGLVALPTDIWSPACLATYSAGSTEAEPMTAAPGTPGRAWASVSRPSP